MKIANINKAYHGPYIINRIGTEYVYVQGGTTPPAPTGCPTVVDDITQYQGSDSEVYDLSTGKWYERNNLNQYEEYGILETVQDLTNTTYYPGKLVIYNGHEYESINGQWVDLGNAGTSRLIDSPSYIYNDSSHNFSIPLNYTGSTDSKWQIQFKPTQNGGATIMGDTSSSDSDDYRIFWNGGMAFFDIVSQRINSINAVNVDKNFEYGNYYIKDLASGTNVVTGTPQTYQRTTTLRLGLASASSGGGDYFQFSGLTMFHGDTKNRDFIPAIDNGEICIFDKVSGEFYKSDNGKYPLSGGSIQQVEVGVVTPVKEYSEKETIETEVTVSSLDEVECPFNGLVAHVGGHTYTYINGEWVEGHHFTNLISGTFTGSTAPTFKVNEQKVTASTTGNNFSYYVAPGSCTSLRGFRSGSTFVDNITSINFDIDTSNCTTFEMLLRENTKITSVTGLPNLNTDNTQNVRGFFNRCSGIQSVDVTDLVTSACTNIDGCFYLASNLTNITGLETWDTSNVTTVGGLFGNTKVATLNISGWDLTKASDASNQQMFVNVNTLTDVYMHGCNINTLNKIKSALYNKGICTIHRDGEIWIYRNNQWILDNSVSGHNNTTNNLTIKVNKISGNSSSGQNVVIPVSSDTSFNQSLSAYTLTSIKDIFRGTTVKDAVMRISSPVTDIGTMFYSATSLVSVDVSLLNTRSARSMGGAFANCYSLTSITGLNNWVTSSFWDFSGVFLNASGLTSLDLSNWETSGVTTMEQMFDGCKGLVTLNLSNWNMQSVTNNNNMFRNCNALTDIIANSTSQSTLERIENRLVSDNKTSVRITRDGEIWIYRNGQWVQQVGPDGETGETSDSGTVYVTLNETYDPAFYVSLPSTDWANAYYKYIEVFNSSGASPFNNEGRYMLTLLDDTFVETGGTGVSGCELATDWQTILSNTGKTAFKVTTPGTYYVTCAYLSEDSYFLQYQPIVTLTIS